MRNKTSTFSAGEGRETLGGHVKKTQDNPGDPAARAIDSRNFFNGAEIFISNFVMHL
jgi:hypothetical protein